MMLATVAPPDSGGTFIASTNTIIVVEMITCPIHVRFFDDFCPECREEYSKLKGINEETFRTQTIGSDYNGVNDKDSDGNKDRNYKEFSEERAKKLYAELLVQYLKKSCKEEEAAEKARAIIRKQCRLRGMHFWSWTA
jgi:hypothetical protein